MTDRPSSSLPFVTDGKGSGIIEDCGGIGGLKAVMEAFKIKAGEDYENYKDWLGRDDIDLTSFDPQEMNRNIAKRIRAFRRAF